MAYLIDSSKVIKVGGKQKPYKMWQAGILLAASPLANSLAGEAREVIIIGSLRNHDGDAEDNID